MPHRHPHEFRAGDHVWADFNGKGYVLAHVVQGPHDPGDGTVKYGIQNPAGGVLALAYRETADIDTTGTGLTFKRI